VSLLPAEQRLRPLDPILAAVADYLASWGLGEEGANAGGVPAPANHRRAVAIKAAATGSLSLPRTREFERERPTTLCSWCRADLDAKKGKCVHPSSVQPRTSRFLGRFAQSIGASSALPSL